MCLSVAVDRPGDVLARSEHAGFEWMIVHNRMGARCGYAKVPAGHPWHGRDSGDLDEIVAVHGGVTFARPDKPCDQGGADDGYWIGFDCAHAWDLPDDQLPMDDEGQYLAEVRRQFPTPDAAVRTQEYVEAQCRSLCEQARDAALVVIAPTGE